MLKRQLFVLPAMRSVTARITIVLSMALSFVIAPLADAATLSISANPVSVSSGSPSTITWSSSDATTCAASGAWSGTKAATGNQSVIAPNGLNTYALNCSGPSGSANNTVVIGAGTPAPALYTLNVTLSGSGTVTSNPSGIACGATCSASYPSGAAVTLSATPAAGHIFSGWSGACSGTGACVAAMSASRSVTATFTPSTTQPPLFTQDFTSAPPISWLNTPLGPVYGFDYSKFGMSSGPYLAMTHESAGGIANSPFIRAAIPTNGTPFYNGTDHWFSPNFQAAFGERLRVGHWRGCTRWSGNPRFFDPGSGEPKLFYQLVEGYRINYSNMQGGLNGQHASEGGRSADGRNLEVVTNLTGLSNLVNRTLIYTSGGSYAGRGYLIEGYDAATGRMRLFPDFCYECGPPPAGSNFIIGPIQGEVVVGSNSGARGNAFNILGSNFRIVNDTGTMSANETLSFQSSGLTATVVSVQSMDRAAQHNVYIANSRLNNAHYGGGSGSELVWAIVNFGDQPRFGNVSPFNQAPVKGFTFYKNDHHDQWFCVEEKIEFDRSPWRTRAWLTTEWGAANLAPGTAGRRSGTSGADGNGIAEFNDFLYMDFQVAMPPLAPSKGLHMQWGSYSGYNLTGSYQDYDSFALSNGKIGHPF